MELSWNRYLAGFSLCRVAAFTDCLAPFSVCVVVHSCGTGYFFQFLNLLHLDEIAKSVVFDCLFVVIFDSESIPMILRYNARICRV